MLRVEIDTDRCSGHGRCYALAPQVFEPDDEGYGRLIPPAASDGTTAGGAAGLVSDEHAEPLRRAGINCPEYAITVTPG